MDSNLNQPPIFLHSCFLESCLTWNSLTFPSHVPACQVINSTHWCGGASVDWKHVDSKYLPPLVMVCLQIANSSNCTRLQMKAWYTNTINPYADQDRPVLFISDPPHLIKPVWNCWENSYGHNWTRNLWVCF